MANFRFIAGFAAVVALLAVATARADLTFPPFTDYVVDQADILPPDAESALVARLKTFQETSGHQLAVATVRSLEGTSVEDYANQLFRAWKLGDAKRNDGALLLVAPNERKVKIEVGYGLEGELTDAVSKLIIENAILPRFKAGDFPGGVSRGADDVMAVFSGQSDDFKARAAAAETEQETPLLVVIVMVLFWIMLAYIFYRAFRNGGGRGRRHGPWIIGGSGMGSSGGWSGDGSGGGFSGGGGGSSGGGGASGGW